MTIYSLFFPPSGWDLNKLQIREAQREGKTKQCEIKDQEGSSRTRNSKWNLTRVFHSLH